MKKKMNIFDFFKNDFSIFSNIYVNQLYKYDDNDKLTFLNLQVLTVDTQRNAIAMFTKYEPKLELLLIRRLFAGTVNQMEIYHKLNFSKISLESKQRKYLKFVLECT